MYITGLKYSGILALGLVLGIFVFGNKNEIVTYENKEAKHEQQSLSYDKDNIEINHEPSKVTLNYKQLLKEKDAQIVALKKELDKLTKQLVNNIAVKEDKNNAPLKKPMSLDEFGKNMVTSMMADIQNIIIEPDTSELASLKEEFAEQDIFSEEGLDKAERIHNFLSDASQKNQLYIDNLECGEKICRLEVSTDEQSKWNSTYASMINQDWFNNMTLSESTGDTNRIIYYIVQVDINADNLN